MLDKQSSDAPPLPLTAFLKLSRIRAEWKTYFPLTTDVVLSINRSFARHPLIDVNRWIEWHKRYGTLGTAYDYLVGAVWGKQSLDSPLERAESIVSQAVLSLEELKQQKQALKVELEHTKDTSKTAILLYRILHIEEAARRQSKYPGRFKLLKQFLVREIDGIRRSAWEEITPDFLRALGALADLDAMFRSALVPFPDWIRSPKVTNLAGLVSILRRKYPNPFVNQLRALYEVTREDLPRTGRIIYNPEFGGAKGIGLAADGDLLIGDLLVDFKVSVKRFKGNYLWQLLSYVALDRLKGENRIKRVGLYNPRFRAFYREPVEYLIRRIGGTNFDDFCEWFRENASKSSVQRAVLHDKERLLKPYKELSLL